MFWRLLFIGLLCLPTVAFAQYNALQRTPAPSNYVTPDYTGAPKDFTSLMSMIEFTIYLLVGIVFTSIVLVYLFGIVRNFQALGTGESDAIRQYYFYGLMAVFIGASLLGLIALIQNTILPSGTHDRDPSKIQLVPSCAYSGGNC